MKTVADQKARESKANANAESTEDLKSLPMQEVEKKLGFSPDGLPQAEAQKRLTLYGPMRLKKRRPIRSSSFSAISGVPSLG